MAAIYVKAGQHLTIDHNNSPSYADELRMEDGAQIDVVGIPLWQLSCPKVVIGNNCRLNAYGATGGNAPNQGYQPPQAGQCRRGADPEARAGENGARGGDGVDLRFIWGIAEVGLLTIDTTGGHGGNGGKGGIGQQGGGAKCVACNGNDGGRGGAGGNAGGGGNAGQVTLTWFVVAAPSPADIAAALEERGSGLGLLPVAKSAPVPGIQILCDGGHPGEPGDGGDGGRGGDGVGCGFYSMGGGNRGWPGVKGNVAMPGMPRTPVIELVPYAPPLTVATTA